MQTVYSFALFFALIIAFSTAQRLAGECAMLCNDLRTEVLTLEMCREAKRTLPKPKVGDFCSVAMEQGFSDVCVPLCMNQKPTVRVAQACRAAAVEMPRPTVRRWCEHGYTKAYEKTMKDLSSHFTNYESSASDAAKNANVASARGDPHFRSPPARRQEMPEKIADVTANFHSKFEKVAEKIEEKQRETEPAAAAEESAVTHQKPVLATIPITIDEVTKDLVVHQDQNAEEAVVMFCRDNVPGDVPSCIRQLLTVVLEKLEEVAAGETAPVTLEDAAPAAEFDAAAGDATTAAVSESEAN